MPLTLSIVTAERTALERDDIARLIVPATEGQITILPSHAPLMTSLAVGELVAIAPDGEHAIAIHGGFLQVARNEVTVLADAAEHADEIDEQRAEEARRRAEERIAGVDATVEQGIQIDLLRAQASLQRALLRLRVRTRRRGTGVPSAR